LLVSILIWLSGYDDLAAITLGFIPGTVGGSVIAGPGVTLLPAWLTPLTATLVHAGVAHLAFNLVMLVFCGMMVERAIGARLVILLYVIGAYAAAAGQWLGQPDGNVPTIGASGAISAWVAAYALLYAERPVPAIGPIPSRVVRVMWLAIAWIGIQLLIGVAGMAGGASIAIGAHIGGFIAGLALTRPMLRWHYRHA